MHLRTLAITALVSTAAFALAGCASESSSSASTAPASLSSEQDSKIGQRVDGSLKVRTESGRTVTLASLYKEQPIVLEFYRGNWCPYCVRQLTQWQSKSSELNDAGGKLVAVSLEKLEGVKGMVEKSHAEYMVVSDYTGDVSDYFDLTFKLADNTVTRYKGFGIDLAASNESGEWELPRPGTYVIDTDGVVRYEFRKEDVGAYSERANPDEVIAAVRRLK